MDRIAGFLLSLQPDLVFLQEVDRGTLRSARMDQAAYLAERLGHVHAFAEAFPFDGGSYGLALTSRLPLLAPRTIHLPHPSPRQDDGNGEPRIALVASIERLTVVVTHLGLSPGERPEQARRIRSELRSHPALLLAGDLNEGPDGAVAREWEGWVRDAFREADGTEEPTDPPGGPNARIDGIFRTTAAPRVRGAFVGPPGYSDHRPVIVDFE